jgi:glycosyltransferase involved in cell wall biosynthesis
VAVLLATRDSARFIEPQLVSLCENATPFTLHWLDDHSSDDTRDRVRRLSQRLRLELCEWHQNEGLGVPGTYFELLACVEADLYLFCDHDDIWQSGKLDATVADLSSRASLAALNYSEPWVFHGEDLQRRSRYYEVMHVTPAQATRLTGAFMFNPAVGNTMGITRALRDLFLSHRRIACEYAAMHDWWLYLLAAACGTAKLLEAVPTTLYRQHASNVFGAGMRSGTRTLRRMWQRQKVVRRLVARQARGFELALASLPDAPASHRMRALAPLVATLERRQSLLELARLLRGHVMPCPAARAAWYSAACVLSGAAA